MPRQLDILALEPYFGGVRRQMLDAIVRCSRHRWTVLKLPPRRIERRLEAAANWFSELLTRHWSGRLDLLFTSEAMNLANLIRLTPMLAKHPSVVYFHDNQLPDLSTSAPARPLDLVNLNTAQSATETWFNSAYHKQMFLIRASAVIDRNREMSAYGLMTELSSKSRLVPPPVDLTAIQQLQAQPGITRNPRTIFVETRGADLRLLNDAMDRLRRRGVELNLITVGPVEQLDPRTPRRAIAERDDAAQARGMLESGVVLSVKPEAASDYLVVRALAAGCKPILPDGGVYTELLPPALHKTLLYTPDAETLAARLQYAVSPTLPWKTLAASQELKQFEPMIACRLIDERIEQLVAAHPVAK